jgi:hypothetical protein
VAAVGSVVLKAFGGTQATYAFTYSQVQVPRACLDTDPETSSTLLLPLLTGVTLPDGSSWAMPTSSYNLTGSAAPCDALDYVAPLQGLLPIS